MGARSGRRLIPEPAVKPLAALLFACFVCGAALADEPAAPPGEAPTRNGPQPEREHREPRAFTVTWEAPRELRVLFDKFLPPPKPDAAEDHVAPMRPWIRDVKKRVPEIAAAEGYFSATLDIQVDDAHDHATVRVTPGPRTTVAAIDIAFEGDLKGEGPEREKRREKLRQSFAMKAGQPLRSADWDVAKTRIEEALTERDYASGTVAASRAEVDAQAATAHLSLTLDSGPPFTFGDVTIKGLKRYSESLVRRVVNLERGERFSRDRLEELQRLIQNGPWFATVVAEIEPDPANAQLVPVTVTVTERPSREPEGPDRLHRRLPAAGPFRHREEG